MKFKENTIFKLSKTQLLLVIMFNKSFLDITKPLSVKFMAERYEIQCLCKSYHVHIETHTECVMFYSINKLTSIIYFLIDCGQYKSL